jgi:hypothetical protein
MAFEPLFRTIFKAFEPPVKLSFRRRSFGRHKEAI